jgi:hypothetical protein
MLENQRTMAEANTAVAGPRKRGRPRSMKDDQQDTEEVSKLIRTQQACIDSFYAATSHPDSRGPADVEYVNNAWYELLGQ